MEYNKLINIYDTHIDYTTMKLWTIRHWMPMVLLCIGLINISPLEAQITPPGMGNINAAAWYAIGVNQHLNAEKTIISHTYIGFGSTSDSTDYKAFKNPTLYVINQEISHHFSPHWKYSGAISYRWKNLYPPKSDPSPTSNQEIRLFTRLHYLQTINNIHLTFAARTEYRAFLNPDGSPANESQQFRLRIAGKIAIPIHPTANQKIVSTTEVFLATSKTHQWSAFGYQDIRFTIYYAFDINPLNAQFHIGYMNDLIGTELLTDSQYLSLDIIFDDPFSPR